MAQYTRSAAEQFRAEESTVGWLWNIFIFSVVVFASTIVIFAGMRFGYQTFLMGQITALDDEIDILKTQVSSADQKQLADFYSQVYNVRSLIPRHTLPSELFVFLESNTNTDVAYLSANYAHESRVLTLQGRARSYEALSRQLEALRAHSKVISVKLGNAVREETGSVNFSAQLDLATSFLLRQ